MISNEQILKLLQAHIDTEIKTVAVQGIDKLDFREVSIHWLFSHFGEEGLSSRRRGGL
jgi:hypothetical protein